VMNTLLENSHRPPRTIPHSAPGHIRSADYLRRIGVQDLPPRTAPFDRGYDPLTVESHLEQSAHLMEALKISMACWMIADESVTRRKVTAATYYGVPTITSGGPFEIAVAQGQLESYLDLCADIGVRRIECGEGSTNLRLRAASIAKLARERCLEVQFELGKKNAGACSDHVVDVLVDQGRRWLDAGAVQLVVEARESPKRVGLFHKEGDLDRAYADRFAHAFGLDALLFEAPSKPSQFALLDHFGRDVHLSNVRLEELLRVEIYRRGLHSDAFGKKNLRLPRLEASRSPGN
jgi:phosphosulfolactate synthase